MVILDSLEVFIGWGVLHRSKEPAPCRQAAINLVSTISRTEYAYIAHVTLVFLSVMRAYLNSMHEVLGYRGIQFFFEVEGILLQQITVQLRWEVSTALRCQQWYL